MSLCNDQCVRLVVPVVATGFFIFFHFFLLHVSFVLDTINMIIVRLCTTIEITCFSDLDYISGS